MKAGGAAAQPSGEHEDLAGVRIAILGCGAVGSALAAELGGASGELFLWSRTPERARELATRVGAEGTCAVDEAREAIERAELVLCCVTDAVLPAFAEEQANAAPQAGPGERAVLHTNGFHGLEVLAPWRAVGWETGKLHPLAAVPPGGRSRLQGAWFATAATSGARRWVGRLLAALGARELVLADDEAASRTLHAAAALLSGGLVALFEVVVSVARRAAADPADAERALASLLRSISRNLSARGARDALTGPAARGATAIVRAHLATLDELDADAAELYRHLGVRMLALAQERGSIGVEQRAELERALRE